MINLDEHKVYVESHKMDMIPYSVAKQAVQEAYNNAEQVETSLNDIIKAFNKLNSLDD
jgi:chaperonin cofactor prefoldin